MALHIKNLKVNISVNQANPEGGEGSSTPVSEQNTEKKMDADKISQDVIEQIFQIIKSKKER